MIVGTRRFYLVLILMTFYINGCDRDRSSQKPQAPGQSATIAPAAVLPVSSGKPVPPLHLDAPPALPEEIDGVNLKSSNEADMQALASRAAGTDYNLAAIYQYWYVQKSNCGQYDLACYLARSHKIDAAFYWLQVAALEEGVDSSHTEVDADLRLLRADPRWVSIRPFILACNRYYESANITATVVVVPKGYAPGTPIPVVLWLHGMGSRPEDFVNSSCQSYADISNVAVVGVSGTIARGPHSFVWSEDFDSDSRRIRAALAEIANRVTVQKGQIIALGFSQGAQVAFDQAVRDADQYAGAIVLSPGLAHADLRLETQARSPLLAQRGFVIGCGSNEHPLTLKVTRADVAWLTASKAQLIHMEYPGVARHAFPADFDDQFDTWIKFILAAQKTK